MKSLLLLIAMIAALWPLPGAAAPSPELLCDSGEKITFGSRWLRGGVVRIEGSQSCDLPWTGREPKLTGAALKAALSTEPGSAEESALGLVEDDAKFLLFRSAGTSLYVDHDLYFGQENDGLVFSELPADSPKPVLHVLHCRSR